MLGEIDWWFGLLGLIIKPQNVFTRIMPIAYIQFGTQVKFHWSRDHNNRTAENTFSAPWYFSEIELEPVAAG